MVVVHTISVWLHHRLGTCCHLISGTGTLVENSSNRALRTGCLCKLFQLSHKGRLQSALMTELKELAQTASKAALYKMLDLTD